MYSAVRNFCLIILKRKKKVEKVNVLDCFYSNNYVVPPVYKCFYMQHIILYSVYANRDYLMIAFHKVTTVCYDF